MTKFLIPQADETQLLLLTMAKYLIPSKINRVDHLFSTINPGDFDVPITTNPSYNVHTKPYSKTSEDEYNHVHCNKFFSAFRFR